MVDFRSFSDEMVKIALGFRGKSALVGAAGGVLMGAAVGSGTGGPEGEADKIDWRDILYSTLGMGAIGGIGGLGYGQMMRMGALKIIRENSKKTEPLLKELEELTKKKAFHDKMWRKALSKTRSLELNYPSRRITVDDILRGKNLDLAETSGRPAVDKAMSKILGIMNFHHNKRRKVSNQLSDLKHSGWPLLSESERVRRYL